MEVLPTTKSVKFEWMTSPVTIDVFDQNDKPIPGSFVDVVQGRGAIPTPFTSVLPITDNTVYPTLGGYYSNGFEVSIFPGCNKHPGAI